MAIGEREPGPPKAAVIAHEYRLRADALEAFPEIAERGLPGDPEFEDAIEAAMDVIDGSAAVKLEMDLRWLGDEDDGLV